MLTKGDAGTYTYPATGSARPHGVTQIVLGSNTTNFAYDADGNMTKESGATSKTVSWTLFNMPLTVTYGANSMTFQYDADHNRVMQTEGTNKTYYLPDGELTPPAGSGPVWHTYFEADGERVVDDYGATSGPTNFGAATLPMSHHYFHNDYQNTIGLVTDDTFNPTTETPLTQNELSDVFGQPRLSNGTVDPNWGANDVTKRRYINQEDLTDAHLIDLNARIYDPLLGKFLSPDPVIADQDDSQSWNAYAYSHNNPMSREDPTGLWYIEGVNPSSSAAGFGNHDFLVEQDSPSSNVGATAGPASPPVAQTQQNNSQPNLSGGGQTSQAPGGATASIGVAAGVPRENITVTAPTSHIVSLAMGLQWQAPAIKAIIQWAPPIIGGLIWHQQQEDAKKPGSGTASSTTAAAPPDPDEGGPNGKPKDAQKAVRRGQGPREIQRIDRPEGSVPNSQWHAHDQGEGALNLDGSSHDAAPSFSQKTLRWLQGYGWNTGQ